MSFKRILLSLSFAASLGAILITSKSPTLDETPKPLQASRAPAAELQKSPVKTSQKQTPAQLSQAELEKAIHHFVQNDKLASFYFEKAQKNIPSSFKLKWELCSWLALGAIFSNSQDFGLSYMELLARLNQNASESVQALNAWMSKDSSVTPQLRSLSMSLVNAMDLSSSEKNQYFSERIFESPYFSNEQGKPEISFHLADSIIFLNQNRASPEDVLSMAESFEEAHKENPKLVSEFFLRVSTYYPELKNRL